jgi:uncharacterized protein YjbI with pentapeptide repeats
MRCPSELTADESRWADLSWADLSCADLSCADLSSAATTPAMVQHTSRLTD